MTMIIKDIFAGKTLFTAKGSALLAMLVAAVISLVAPSCTTNNGDIGRYYGTWAVESVTLNGHELEGWNADGTWTNFSFQNNIVCIARYDKLQDKTECWGTWEERDGILYLDFTHKDDRFTPGTGIYSAPEWLHFVPNGVTELHIDQATGRTMTLSNISVVGGSIVYKLRKTY